MTLRVGDRVRVTHLGAVGVIEERRGGGAWNRVRLLDPPPGWIGVLGRSEGAYGDASLEKVEDEKPRPLGLAVHDKVVNLKTGREGRVLLAPISRELKVYDVSPPWRDGVPVDALEEYEHHYPGTYDVFRAKDFPW